MVLRQPPHDRQEKTMARVKKAQQRYKAWSEALSEALAECPA